MDKKKKIYIFSIFILLLGLWTEAFASGPVSLFGSKNNNDQEILNDKEFHSIYEDGIYGMLLDNKAMTLEESTDNENELARLNNSVTTVASRGTSSNSKYSSEDLYWLAKIIEAEAEGEPYNGKVAVGNVILNRVDSDKFPDEIYDVIFEYHKHIPQFSPVADGSIHNSPSPKSIQAAKDAANGLSPVGDATYFFNPTKASGAWIVNNKSYVMNIGDHNFYR